MKNLKDESRHSKVNKRGQQEIVGFVLIVVLVVVGLMVFLVISLRGGGEVSESVEVSNILNVVMKTTTECAIVYEPDYDDFEDLFKSCHKGKNCENLERDACDYLNESLRDLVEGVMVSEAGIAGWRIELIERDGNSEAGLLEIEDWGNCSGRVSAAQRNIVSGGDSLVVRMRVCMIS